jgi:methylated-DNA-[protein]-cysteine S-methyltransferase
MMNNRKQVNLQYYDSPCGRLVLASIDDELCLCDWNDMPSAERNMRRLAWYANASFKTETSSVLEETKRQLDEYFAGKRKSFNIRLRLVGTDFQHEVWNALLNIRKPQAVRAVAGAIGANGISILIPCHRVIGCNNSLTGYAGGLEAKKVLLGIETHKNE